MPILLANGDGSYPMPASSRSPSNPRHFLIIVLCTMSSMKQREHAIVCENNSTVWYIVGYTTKIRLCVVFDLVPRDQRLFLRRPKTET
mmetsp:Transcript_18712/g.46310  ORF Transcript_18712/g.46310 Transcript_18712/m.46310 type:complete len:88 (-) Transcript_18712:186-449(-)